VVRTTSIHRPEDPRERSHDLPVRGAVRGRQCDLLRAAAQSNRDQPGADNLSPRLVVDLLGNPAWFLGSCGVIGGLLLQAAALSGGALALVEPIRIFKLSATLLLAGIVFHRRLSREWLSAAAAAAAMAVGLGGLLYFLSPSASHGGHLPALRWATGIVINLAVIAALVGWAPARRQPSVPSGAARDRRRNLVRAGPETALQPEHRQAPCGDHPVGLPGGEDGTEAVCGERGSLGLDQRRWPAGRRATRDHRSRPVVSILWGTPASGETVRGGFRLVLAVISTAVIGAGIVALSRSPLVSVGDGEPGQPAAVSGSQP